MKVLIYSVQVFVHSDLKPLNSSVNIYIINGSMFNFTLLGFLFYSFNFASHGRCLKL